MKKRLLGSIVAVGLIIAVLTGCQSLPVTTGAPQETKQPTAAVASKEVNEADILYVHAYLQTLSGGFTDTIEEYAVQQGLTVDEFRSLCEKAAADMTEEELAKMNAIRDQQWKPDGDTLMQKVITMYDMGKYLSGEYKTPKGFISVCADVKQYETVQDMYYGLRLDYEGTYFKPEGESYAVIRFYAANVDQAVVPKSSANGGDVEDPYPFGGVGFTTGTNGRWGSPEWVMSEFTILNDGAQLFEDGKEVLRGVYVAEAGRFLAIEEMESVEG